MKLARERHARLVSEQPVLIIEALLGIQEIGDFVIGGARVKHPNDRGRDLFDIDRGRWPLRGQ